MFPFVRPLNIHPPSGGYYAMPFGSMAPDPFVTVPVFIHDYEIYPEKKSDLAICVIPASYKTLQEYKITRSIIKKYAEKCNADLVELFGDACPHWPLVNKYRVYFVASKYYRTLYLDADVIINDNAPNIFEVTPEDKFCVHNEIPDLISNETDIDNLFTRIEEQISKQFNLPMKKNHVGYNAGIMLIPNKLAYCYCQPRTNKMLKEWIAEQMYLNLTLNSEDVFLLDGKFNHLYFNIDFWENLPEAHFVHLAGSNPLEYRLALLDRIKNKNYKPLLPPDSSNFIPKWVKKYVV